MRPLDSGKLQAFVAVARDGGFSRAARTLSRTQSSVSEAVSQLEETLGHKLFVRDARVTRLTAEGRILLEHAERVLDELESMRSRLSSAGAEPEGELTVGTTDTLACYLLPPVFAALRKRYPRIQLRLENQPSPAIAQQIAERRLEVGVMSLPLPTQPSFARLEIETLRPIRDVVICPPEHVLARRRSLTPRALAEHPLLLLDRTTGTRTLLERAFEAAGRKPQVVMETRSVDVLKRLVELGFGISVVPSISVEREVRDGSLSQLRLRGLGGAPRAVGLITHAKGSQGPAARAFVEVARELLHSRA